MGGIGSRICLLQIIPQRVDICSCGHCLNEKLWYKEKKLARSFVEAMCRTRSLSCAVDSFRNHKYRFGSAILSGDAPQRLKLSSAPCLLTPKLRT